MSADEWKDPLHYCRIEKPPKVERRYTETELALLAEADHLITDPAYSWERGKRERAEEIFRQVYPGTRSGDRGNSARRLAQERGATEPAKPAARAPSFSGAVEGAFVWDGRAYVQHG